MQFRTDESRLVLPIAVLRATGAATGDVGLAAVCVFIERHKLFMLLGILLLLVGLDYLLRPMGNVDGFYLLLWSSITYLG